MKPWVKLWRPRPGSRFEAQVSGPAKCVFARLIALVDDTGRAALAGGDPFDGCARLLEWPAGPPRRGLRRLLSELVEHGCVRLTPGLVEVSLFSEYQATTDPSKVHQRSDKGPSKVDQRSGLTPRNHVTENDKIERERRVKREGGETPSSRSPNQVAKVVELPGSNRARRGNHEPTPIGSIDAFGPIDAEAILAQLRGDS